MIFAKVVWNINKPWEHHFNEVGYINYIYENVNLFLKYISNMNDWKREYIYIYIYIYIYMPFHKECLIKEKNVTAK